MVRIRKAAVQIHFEILEYLFYNRSPQPRTYVWRRATSLSYDDFLKHLIYVKEKISSRRQKRGSVSYLRMGETYTLNYENPCPQSCKFTFDASQLISPNQRCRL